jgi:hypothetical protein
VDMRGSRKDLLAGAVFVGFGLAFGVTASTYEVGSALRMGPGYFPLVLGGLLVLLGVLIAANGLAAGDTDSDEFGPVPWKAAALLIGALLFFGFTVRGLGLAPSVFVTVFLAAMAGRDVRVLPAAMVAGSLTALSIIIFVFVLQLRLPLVGPWLGG